MGQPLNLDAPQPEPHPTTIRERTAGVGIGKRHRDRQPSWRDSRMAGSAHRGWLSANLWLGQKDGVGDRRSRHRPLVAVPRAAIMRRLMRLAELLSVVRF